jgi:CubicO group peptidase (beta-lactamase class C family)
MRGFGITHVDDPQPIDGDTLFRIAPTTKTFTGAVVMRLVEQERLDMNSRIRN